MRTTFINCLIERARIDQRIFLITSDMGFSILEEFRDEFPDNFLNAGIAEQNAMGVAAGLALSGKIVYVYSITPFVTMRCFEQVRNDIAYMNNNVRIVGVGAGYTYGSAGVTHHSIEDIAIMRVLPNMTICCPGDPIEVRELINQSFDHKGPIYFRLGKSGEKNIHPPNTKIIMGKAAIVTEGKDIAIITTSNMLEDGKCLTDSLTNKSISAKLISMPTIKPLDVPVIQKLITDKIPIITLEEHNIIGGLGSAIAEVISESGQGIKFKRYGIPDIYTHSIGCQKYLRHECGFDNIEKDILNWLQ